MASARVERVGHRRFRLVESFIYVWERKDKGFTVFTIPSGFVCDLATVPASLPVVDALDLGFDAPIPHDALYQYGGHLPLDWVAPWRPITRKEADRIFYEMLREDGVPRFKAWLAYRAVRLLGWRAWRERAL